MCHPENRKRPETETRHEGAVCLRLLLTDLNTRQRLLTGEELDLVFDYLEISPSEVPVKESDQS